MDFLSLSMCKSNITSFKCEVITFFDPFELDEIKYTTFYSIINQKKIKLGCGCTAQFPDF